MTLRDGFPPFYPERPSSVLFEPNQAYLGYAAAALFVGVLLVLPGVRGKDRMFFLLRWTTSLFIGVSIVACVQGISWHVAVVNTDLPYTGSGQERVQFKVGLMIGLASFNVTLENNVEQNNEEKRLVSSEEFHFLESDESLEKGLKAGLPFPILNVLEHFSVKRVSSQWMWGRRYWIAGHYSLYMLWSAFATWIITNILLHTVLRYGGLMMTFTGLLMVGANAAFTSIRAHGCELEIHIGYYEPAVLKPTYGWCFWLCMGVGILCVLCGCVIFISDQTCNKPLRRFFNLQKESDFELMDVSIQKSSSHSSSINSQMSVGEVNSSFNGFDERGSSPDLKAKLKTFKFEASNSKRDNTTRQSLASKKIVEVDAESDGMVDDVFTSNQPNM